MEFFLKSHVIEFNVFRFEKKRILNAEQIVVQQQFNYILFFQISRIQC